MKETIIKEISSLLRRDDVKHEVGTFSKIIMDFILNKLNPYMYVIITIVVGIFLINVANIILLILLFRKQNKGNMLL